MLRYYLLPILLGQVVVPLVAGAPAPMGQVGDGEKDTQVSLNHLLRIRCANPSNRGPVTWTCRCRKGDSGLNYSLPELCEKIGGQNTGTLVCHMVAPSM